MTGTPTKRGLNFVLLISFATAGLWAGSVVSYLVVSAKNGVVAQTAEIHRASIDDGLIDSPVRRKFFNREPRTKPYDKNSAPNFDNGGNPDPVDGTLGDVPNFFDFPPEKGPVEKVAPVEEVTPESKPRRAGGIINAIRDLLNGEGNLQGIIQIATTLFALFGGAQMGSSDMALKTILSLFSKKASFHAILSDKIKKAKPPRSSRRRNRTSRSK